VTSSPGGILIPEWVERDQRRKQRLRLIDLFPYPVPQKWWPFIGNNHESTPSAERKTNCGPLRFGHHVGKPLTDELYYELVNRAGMYCLRVYHPNWGEWTDGQILSTAIVRLGEDFQVKDIELWL
jgi:hypothetical protein